MGNKEFLKNKYAKKEQRWLKEGGRELGTQKKVYEEKKAYIRQNADIANRKRLTRI